MVLQENVSPLQWVGVSNPYHMQNNSNSHVEEFVVVYQLCVACSRYIWLPVKCLAAAINLYGFKSLTGFDVLHTLTLLCHCRQFQAELLTLVTSEPHIVYK